MSSTFVRSLAVLLGLIFSQPSLADDPPLGAKKGVLLLRNGELVEGEITLAGDRYDVAVHGGRIHIKRSDVEFEGRTVSECYQRRKEKVESSNVQEDLDLTEWCLRHALYEQAALALADAIDADASHPRIALLERRLKFALDQPAETTKVAQTANDSASIRDLDRMVNGLPPGSVEMFTSSIQPMLLNHCSTAGCHGTQNQTPLRLLRIPASRAPSRRVTQRNLFATLTIVDRDNPENSQLLTSPARPHGTAKSAIFTSREAAQYRQLVRWVYLVANQKTLEAPATTGEAVNAVAPSPVKLQSADKPLLEKASPSRRARMEEVKAAKKSSSIDQTPPAQGADTSHPVKVHSAEPADAESGDPFDPEEFNRRFFKSAASD